MDEYKSGRPRSVVRLHSGDENERTRLHEEVVPNTESYDVAVTTYEWRVTRLASLTQKVYWRCLFSTKVIA